MYTSIAVVDITLSHL